MLQTLVELIAKYFIIIPVIGLLVVLWRIDQRQRVRLAVMVVVGGVISLALAKLGGHFYSDPRPYQVGHFTPLITVSTDNGFPSDHSMLAGFLAFGALYYSRKVGSLLIPVAVLLGLARMAVGAHHAIDIIGGFAIAGIATLAAIGITHRLR